MDKKTINILLCIDDFWWDYTRHCAVTMLSVLETNKNNKIKFYIMSSCLPEGNIKELKRIVDLYNQEIEFIIHDNIIPEEIKKNLINRRTSTWWTFYRLFFPKYIKNIDRILYMDCDVLVLKDISSIFNMDMKWKVLAGYYDIPISDYTKKKYFWIDNYINAWVILIDVNKYKENNINGKMIKDINKKYWEFIYDVDQDYLNIIFKNDIFIYNSKMNYLVLYKYFNKWIKKASILHCLQKPYKKNNNVPKFVRKLYFKYLEKTKRKDYVVEYWKQKRNTNMIDQIRNFFVFFIYRIMWRKISIYFQIFTSKIRGLLGK